MYSDYIPRLDDIYIYIYIYIKNYYTHKKSYLRKTVSSFLEFTILFFFSFSFYSSFPRESLYSNNIPKLLAHWLQRMHTTVKYLKSIAESVGVVNILTH